MHDLICKIQNLAQFFWNRHFLVLCLNGIGPTFLQEAYLKQLERTRRKDVFGANVYYGRQYFVQSKYLLHNWAIGL